MSHGRIQGFIDGTGGSREQIVVVRGNAPKFPNSMWINLSDRGTEPSYNPPHSVDYMEVKFQVPRAGTTFYGLRATQMTKRPVANYLLSGNQKFKT
jgi:hypothetical protein